MSVLSLGSMVVFRHEIVTDGSPGTCGSGRLPVLIMSAPCFSSRIEAHLDTMSAPICGGHSNII